MLTGTDVALWAHHDLAMLDLDGVVYIGGDAVPGAADHLAAARSEGMRLAFVTNNASRTPDTVAAHLTRLAIPAEADDVVTSAQAAAHVLATELGSGAPVALVGAEGLRLALEAEGLVPVGPEDEAQAAVTGYGPDVVWGDLMRIAVRIRDGLRWVASNTDLTIPTAYGVAPGHGVQVEMLRRFTGVEPVVAGKPARPLLDETVRRVGGRSPLMVGDRLDTDILGARNAGLPSLLVMTGVTGLAELVGAPPGHRPTYLAADLGGLGEPQPSVEAGPSDAVELRGWSATSARGALTVEGAGSVDDWWRVVAVSGWAHLDRTGAAATYAGLVPPSA